MFCFDKDNKESVSFPLDNKTRASQEFLQTYLISWCFYVLGKWAVNANSCCQEGLASSPGFGAQISVFWAWANPTSVETKLSAALSSEQPGSLCHIPFEGCSYCCGKIELKSSASKAGEKIIHALLSISSLPLTHLYFLYEPIQCSGKCSIY